MGNSIFDIRELKFENNLMNLHELGLFKVKKESLLKLIDESLDSGNRDLFLEYSIELKEIILKIKQLESTLRIET